MVTITKETLIKMLNNVKFEFEENHAYLSELDSNIGDGDHGVSMLRGFRAVVASINCKEYIDLSSVLQDTGKILLKDIGGTCGPLFATIFLKAAERIKCKQQIEVTDLYPMFNGALVGVKQMGRVSAGEKTMVDALEPSVLSFKKSIEEKKSIKQAFEIAMNEAQKGAESTKQMLATKGRARYQKEKSLGHQDAGATSVYLLFKGFYNGLA